MATRYSAEFLLHLRDSPLCVRPENLPPAEEWMGPPQEQTRTQSKVLNERPRNSDGTLVDQTNRRPGVERHMSRNSANPDDIIFGPPRTSFTSSRSKAVDGEKGSKDLDSQGRYNNHRNRTGDSDGDRFRDGRGNPLRRRGDSDQDEGWSTVKPRKSFGAEGAERFSGKMGGNFREDRRTQRDKDDREPTRDRQTRGFDGFVREKDADGENRTRNGLGRNKLDSWQRDGSNNDGAMPERRDRDRTKSWRDRDPELADNRSNDKRWGRDRDQRGEREPEWFDEPVREQKDVHTQQDFQKWMESMKRAKNASTQDSQSAAEALIESEKPAVKSAPAVERGPDKFFMAFGGSNIDNKMPSEQQQDAAAPAKKTIGKSSRFTSFFGGSAPPDDGRRTESSAPPSNAPSAPPGFGPGAGGLGTPPVAPPDEEKQAFQNLLAKLQKQSMSATPPAMSLFSAPPPQRHGDGQKKSSVGSPDPSQQLGGERREDAMSRPQQPHEIHAPRPQQQNARPEQLLQDLVGHHQRASSQSSNQREQPAARNNSNTEFLMNLMRAGPDPQRSEQLQNLISRQQHHPQQNAKSPEGGRPAPPPGFGGINEQVRSPDQDPRNASQMNQRVPPGLDQMPPNWMHGPPPPSQRGGGGGGGGGHPMMPPPGLPGGPPNRNMHMPPMFPPNFPPGGMPPPDAIGGMPPRNMPMPPPGFFNGPPPPHGFAPPPGMPGFNGHPPPQQQGGGGPDLLRSYGSPPFEGRGMPGPPPGEAGRGNYRQ